MPLLTDEKYAFQSRALPDDALAVVKFKGLEGLSRPYQFDILLASEKPDIDLTEALGKPAVFTIRRTDGDMVFHGLPARFEQQHSYREYVFYRAVLVPRFRMLSLTFHNRVFLDMALPDILAAVLKDGGLTENDFEFRLEKDYPTWETVCQYRESHFDFISRWMERDGIYYYFEQTDDVEKLILTDTHLVHSRMPQGRNAVFSPPSGLDGAHLEEVVQSFIWRQRPVPKEILLTDYNYRTPSLELTARADVKPSGRGLIHINGEHFRTPEEGRALAGVRAEELLCGEKVFSGQSRIPFIRPGYTFTLQEHFRGELDREYLTTRVEHEGSQAAYLTADLKQGLPDGADALFYKNAFQAIEADRQFRPARRTPKARFYGTMNAVIDATGGGQYAELDEMGRYKVKLPFDRSGRKDGKASAFLRMMQPYGGSDHGMHLPLHKGVEVLLTFIDGDPDRPVIAGALPNPDHPSPVSDQNRTQSLLTSSGQNKIHMEDQAGSQRILMQSPTANSFIRIGAPNDPPAVYGQTPHYSTLQPDKDGIKLVTGQGFDIKAGFFNELVFLEKLSVMGGLDARIFGGARSILLLGHQTDISTSLVSEANLALHWKIGNKIEMKGSKKKVELETVEVAAVEKAIQGKIEKIRGQLTAAAGKVNKIKGQVNEVVASGTRAEGRVDDIQARADRVEGELSTAVETADHVKGELTEVVGEATEAARELKEAVGTGNTVADELTRVADDFKSVTSETFRINKIDSTV